MRALLVAGLACLVTLIGAPIAVSAQVCAGDCDGDGEVSVSEIITAVNIVLGGAALDTCSALLPGGSGTPGVAHLVAAVNSALCACGACPTPPPTATATPPLATATETRTPTPTPLVSRWIEDTYRLKGSTCPKAVNDAIRDQIPGQTAVYVVTERDGGVAQVDLEDGSVLLGTIDNDGVLHLMASGRDSQGSCTVYSQQTLAVSLRAMQSTGTYRYEFTSSGCPRSIDCTLTITARWRSMAANLGRRRAADLAAQLRGALLSP